LFRTENGFAGMRPARMPPPLELWGGPECSVVRVGDDYRDQADETGHAARLADLDAIAELGIRTVRFPIIWETVARHGLEDYDWSEVDARVERVRALGLTPIAGLIHHGSGPADTSLLDPEFRYKLARYAAAVAARYPWIELWTPVNEPLTTARFSCLYGHWYPHRRNEADFVTALVNQCHGTALAMIAIREIIPSAKLVQTEDYGRVFSTPALAYQADFENARRLLSLDLLCGKVDAGHDCFGQLTDNGADPALLDWFADGKARPDIIGINHYLTSDRYLDQRRRRYPGVASGGNGHARYVDVEAIRVAGLEGETGPKARLAEVWQRYRLPIAVTEVHNGCSREEQLRWLMDVWHAAEQLRAEGADIRAVTIWSMFGAVDWRSLLTRREGHVEQGIFDLRGRNPRKTLLATAASALATRASFSHPVLETPGWWHRPMRFLGPRAGESASPMLAGCPLLITGATGTLGQAFARICEARGIAHRLTSRSQLDIADPVSIHRVLTEMRPWAVINTAGFVRVEQAEHERDACFRENAVGPERLAEACAAAVIPLVTFSSDLVFDGLAGRPYVEDDRANPTSVYGQSKERAEQLVLAACPGALVVRTSAFFGPWDSHNFVWDVLTTLGRGEAVQANDRAVVSPTYVPDLVHATLDLLVDGECGLWHVANAGQASWLAFAGMAAIGAGLKTVRLDDQAGPATNTSLESSRGFLLRPLDEAIASYHRELALTPSWR